MYIFAFLGGLCADNFYAAGEMKGYTFGDSTHKEYLGMGRNKIGKDSE